MTALCPGFTHTEFQDARQRARERGARLPLAGGRCRRAAGLDGLAKNRAIVMPGALNKVLGNFSAVSPHVITRRISAAIVKRADH